MSDSFFVTTPFKDIILFRSTRKRFELCECLEKCAKKHSCTYTIIIAAGCKEFLAFGPILSRPTIINIIYEMKRQIVNLLSVLVLLRSHFYLPTILFFGLYIFWQPLSSMTKVFFRYVCISTKPAHFLFVDWYSIVLLKKTIHRLLSSTMYHPKTLIFPIIQEIF